ncbi:MAG: site-specific integrase [Candidatus Angelobacter sp.]|nr:site-specific integrase [Candidatus Angelobacter sp.]
MRGSGTVVLDKRINQWNLLWWQEGKRKSKSLGHHKTKASACKAAKPLRDALETQPKITSTSPDIKMRALVEQYRAEKMPTRFDTRRSYEIWLKNYILPKWGECVLSELQARPVEMWLDSLMLSPKSRAHIRALLSGLWDFAMWAGKVPTQRNPIELVTVKGASGRTRKPRSLTVKEFQMFSQPLREPFRTLALVCVCLGLRISEALALKWSDVDWLASRLTVERGIVCQHVDDVKTPGSEKCMTLSRELLAVLKAWKQSTQFSADGDWIFASPVKIGRLPFSYTGVLHVFQKAAVKAGIGTLGTHTMRHSYRSWLDAVGTSVAVQQKLMRHSDVRTTMNVYGDVVTDEMAQAGAKVAGLALNGL